MLPLPHIGPLSSLHERVNRWHDPLRIHMAWASTLTGLATLACLSVDFVAFGAPSRWWAVGFAALTIVPNAILWVLFSKFPKIEAVNMRGLTMINKWLEEHHDLVLPVARWLEACGDLDTRHFQCLRERIEGSNRPPGRVGGQWLIRELSNGTLCRNPHDMLDGKMRDHVMLARKEGGYRVIDGDTFSVERQGKPRRL